MKSDLKAKSSIPNLSVETMTCSTISKSVKCVIVGDCAVGKNNKLKNMV